MYDELVKTLRLRAALWEKTYDEDTVLKQAADAIEDLLFFTRRLEELRKDGWYLQRTVSDMNGCCIQQMDIPKPPKEDDK